MVAIKSHIVVLLLAVLQLAHAFDVGIGKRWLSASMVGRDALTGDQWMQLYKRITLSEEEEENEELDEASYESSHEGLYSERVQQVDDLATTIAKYVQIAPNDEEHNELCFVLNGKKYSKSDDSFYLKTSELESQARIFDSEVLDEKEIAIGSNNTAPIIVLYGCETDEEFDDFNLNLFNEAKFGKIRLTWRPTCTVGEEPEYATSATLSDKNWNQKSNVHFTIEDNNLKIKNPVTLKYLDQKELEDLDIKFTALLLQKYRQDDDFDSFFDYFKNLSDNFPAVAPKIASREDIDTELARILAHTFEKRKVSHELLGLYVNGQQRRLTELDETTLPFILAKEWSRVKTLEEKLSSFPGADLDQFLKYFTVGYSYTAFFDKNRYDFYRAPGFSEAVIFFNDFENDELYENLPRNNQAFLEPSSFEPIPNIRQNWNDLLFYINFDDPKQLEENGAVGSLLEALEQMKTGYPIRLGLVPFSARGSNAVVDQIYLLKSKSSNSLPQIIDYLRSLIRNPEDIDSEGKEETIESKEYLERFRINDTVIAMNGVVLPFEPKAWKIHTSRILTADINYLKTELRAIKDESTLSVRQMLHHRSKNLKNPVYLPNRMMDETFTRMNNVVLKELTNRVISYFNPNQKIPIHTVTLVDDFNSESALGKIKALLKNTHNSVGFRLIHVGEVTNFWNEFKLKFSTGKIPVIKSPNTSKVFDSSQIMSTLQSWLPDISMSALRNPFAVINGKFINTNDDLHNVELWHNILVHHSSRTLDVLNTLYQIGAIREDLKSPSAIEELTAAVIKYVHHGSLFLDNGIPYTTESSMPRVSLSELEKQTITKPLNQSAVTVTLLLDPVEERTQRLLYLSSLLKDLPFVKTEIVLVPTTNLTLNPVHRFYDSSKTILGDEFTTEIEYPHNIKPDSKSILIEAHVFDESAEVSIDTIDGEPGVCLQLVDRSGAVIDKGISMKSFGYVQLSLPGLMKGLKVESCDAQYQVTAFSSMGEANYVETESFDVSNTLPTQIQVKVRKSSIEPIVYQDDGLHALVVIHDGKENAAMNKMEKIVRQAGNKVMFYILAQNIDRVSHILPPSLEFQIIDYAWPLWLRPQRFRAKELEAKSILLLDVIIPKDVDQLVVISLDDDADDEIPWNDISSLSDAVFYLKQTETQADSYWNFGYWKKYLEKYNLPFYDLFSSYVINMKKLREIDAGTTLRLHYHLLSKSFISLDNFRSDLVNSIQLKVPISTLENRHDDEDYDEFYEQDEL
ncbi:unnamed protein product [Kluyveromyces dobzhanskii CBS 2104]|uniref:WGS project CCBQ000000000 data, contig 00272 n=1 Tax=Kluyveromyces dobzhanskii CBS 2104 TaxID=1427455 RepID=A0A0A8L8U5_9SACH|nr:unnamed protein product [Kluyveromyces dobzhanskii CBS 2104]